MKGNKQNKVITRSAFVRSTTPEMIDKRQVEFVLSSEAVDSYGTVFKMSGWNFNRYIKNPVVCFQHRWGSDDPDNIIGTSSIRVEEGKLIGVVTFEDPDINPKAEKIFRKVQSGTLKMASVGARVLKAHFGDSEQGEDQDVLYFDEQELIEWSIVAVGSNPDAHKRNAQSVEEIRSSIVNEIEVDVNDVKVNRSVQEAQLIVNKNRI